MDNISSVDKNVKRFDFLWQLKILLMLFLLGAMAYANAVSHPFVHDDVVFIQNNPQIAKWDHLERIFLHPAFPNKDIPVNPYYRPFLELIYRFEYAFFAFDPQGYHLINIFMHIMNSLLVYVLMNFLWRQVGLAVAVALIFLLHPIQTEAVACVAGISNLVFSFFLLTGLIYYAVSRQAEKKFDQIVLYGFSVICFVVALLAKEQAVIFLGLIVLCEFCFPPSDQKKNCRRLRISGFFIVLLMYLLWRAIVMGQATTEMFTHKDELMLRVLHIPSVLLMELSLLFFPQHLHYYRSFDILQPFVLPLIVFFLIGGGIYFLLKAIPKPQQKMSVFALAWFLIALAPTLNILPLINEYSLILTAEHFLYLPVIGWGLFVVTAWNHFGGIFFQKRKEQIDVLMIAGMCVLFLAMTIQQNTYWRGEIPLFERMVAFEKNFGRGHILLAKAYYFDHQFDRAIKEYKTAETIMNIYFDKTKNSEAGRVYAGFIKGIHFDLAHCYESKGQLPDAVAEYEQALELDPRDPVLQNNLGADYLQLNNFDQAMIHFVQAVQLNAVDLMAKNNLGICYIQKGQFAKAKELFEEILKQDGNFGPARQNLEKLNLQFNQKSAIVE